MLINWSAGLPSHPTIRVRIPLKLTVLFCKLFVKNGNKQKEAGDGPFLKQLCTLCSSPNVSLIGILLLFPIVRFSK